MNKEDFEKIWNETLGKVEDLEFECSPQLEAHLMKIANDEYTDDEILKCMSFSDPDFVSYMGTDKEDLDVTPERLEEIFSCQPDKSQLTQKEYEVVMDHIYKSLNQYHDKHNLSRSRHRTTIKK